MYICMHTHVHVHVYHQMHYTKKPLNVEHYCPYFCVTKIPLDKFSWVSHSIRFYCWNKCLVVVQYLQFEATSMEWYLDPLILFSTHTAGSRGRRRRRRRGRGRGREGESAMWSSVMYSIACTYMYMHICTCQPTTTTYMYMYTGTLYFLLG